MPRKSSNRTDISRYDADFRYRWRPETWLRTIDSGVESRFVTKRAGRLESGTVKLRIVEFENQHGDQLDFAWTWREEDLEMPFEISEGIFIPPSRYDFQLSSATFETADSRELGGRLELTWGTFFTGTRLSMESRITWRPSAALLLEGTWEQNDIRLDEGDFTTRLVTARVNISFSSQLFWDTFAQYDNGSQEVLVNSRLRWLIEDGREVFLVFNPSFHARHDRLAWQSSEAIVKVSWNFRY